MKKKIKDFAVDFLLIAVIFAVTDYVTLKVFHSESFWLEMGTYVVLYGIVFGGKRAIVNLWKRRAAEKKEND